VLISTSVRGREIEEKEMEEKEMRRSSMPINGKRIPLLTGIYFWWKCEKKELLFQQLFFQRYKNILYLCPLYILPK
jgi:hypothetical protein